MNKETCYDAKDIAEKIGCDAQALREQVKADIAQGRNKQNWNAKQIGNSLVFSKKAFDKWLEGTGPVFSIPEKLAETLILLGMAKEAEG